jgi:hypothetical protein
VKERKRIADGDKTNILYILLASLFIKSTQSCPNKNLFFGWMQASKFKSILLETKNFLKALSAGVTLSFFRWITFHSVQSGDLRGYSDKNHFFHKILCWNFYCLMYLVKNQMASMLKLWCWTKERYLRTIFFIVICYYIVKSFANELY